MIAKLVLILATQIGQIWEISFYEINITESSFSRLHHGNNTFVIFSLVPNFMMKFAFFSHVRVWLKGLKHMRGFVNGKKLNALFRLKNFKIFKFHAYVVA